MHHHHHHMSGLSDFFTQLGQDAQLMEDYKQNPEAVMRAHGLTDEQINAVMTGDMEKLKTLSGDSSYQSYDVISHGNGD
uniref:Extradiol ring-cleavage dioxygenase LigAB LigA subunit domain-containing protein n=1 Tax=Shewanella oneidensis TaxID=70863 RepID=UPI0039A3F8D4